jgi:hypothetical protein
MGSPAKLYPTWQKLILAFFLMVFPAESYAWGFYAHRQINRMAVFTLPKEIFGFYKNNIEYLSTHAVDPDKKRYIDKKEAPRHFIDLDRYGKYPYDSLPHKWMEAAARFGEDTLNANGTVPWQINIVYKRLVQAFRERDSVRILKLSAYLGHYVGDACVPLHTTRNYNGQLSGQTGIHAFWETSVPELLGDKYNYFIGKARYVDSIAALGWKIVLESNNALDSVLNYEKQLSEGYPEDRKYTFAIRSGQTIKTYSPEYISNYNIMLNGQAERRLRMAIYYTGCLWMSAWIDAGQPDLRKPMAQTSEEDEKVLEDGVMIGRKEE